MTQLVLCPWCTLSIDQGDAQFSCSTFILTHIAKVQCHYCVYYSFIDKCAIALKLFQLPEHPWMKIISQKRKQDSSRLLKCWMVHTVMHGLSLNFWAALWILLKMIIGIYKNRTPLTGLRGYYRQCAKLYQRKVFICSFDIYLFIAQRYVPREKVTLLWNCTVTSSSDLMHIIKS